jgi:hypothetical protein
VPKRGGDEADLKSAAARHHSAALARAAADLRRRCRHLPSGLRDSGARRRARLIVDARVVAGLIKRHRLGFAVGAAAIALMIGVAVYGALMQWLQPGIDSSFQNAQIVQLTTSGNAEQPAISPDGKYVAYIQRAGSDYSVWIRQTATASNAQIVQPASNALSGGVTVTPMVTLSISSDFRLARRVRCCGGSCFAGQPRRLIERVWSPIGWSPTASARRSFAPETPSPHHP